MRESSRIFDDNSWVLCEPHEVLEVAGMDYLCDLRLYSVYVLKPS